MARDHKTESRQNRDGSMHYTRHSYEGTTGKGIRRSHDVIDGQKCNDHVTDQETGETYYYQDTTDGKHKAGDVTDSKGNFLRNNLKQDNSSWWNW